MCSQHGRPDSAGDDHVGGLYTAFFRDDAGNRAAVAFDAPRRAGLQQRCSLRPRGPGNGRRRQARFNGRAVDLVQGAMPPAAEGRVKRANLPVRQHARLHSRLALHVFQPCRGKFRRFFLLVKTNQARPCITDFAADPLRHGVPEFDGAGNEFHLDGRQQFIFYKTDSPSGGFACDYAFLTQHDTDASLRQVQCGDTAEQPTADDNHVRFSRQVPVTFHGLRTRNARYDAATCKFNHVISPVRNCPVCSTSRTGIPSSSLITVR